jgi:hypothetical protein
VGALAGGNDKTTKSSRTAAPCSTENAEFGTIVSRPRFLADHDLNEHIILGVRRREPTLEFTRVRDVGLSDRPDPEILDYAKQHGFLVVSHDVNTMPAEAYGRLSSGKGITGLFMVPQTAPVSIIIEDLLLIWSSSETEEWRDQVNFLPLT